MYMSYLIPYIGSKRNIMRNILKAIPYHLTYVEVFGGSGTVLLTKKKSYREIYNDSNEALYNFMKQVKDNYQKLYLYIKRMPISYQKVEGDDIERAGKFYINMKFFGWGGKLNSGEKMKRSFFRPDNRKKIDVKRIIEASLRLRDVVIINEDYKRCIDLYDSPDTFFYCDPPYYIKREDYYINGKDWVNDDKHIDFYNKIKDIKGKFLISYNDCDFINELYKDYFIKRFDAVYTVNSGNELSYGKEVLISNYEY